MNSGRQIYTVLLFLLATSSPGIALASGPLHDPTQQLLAPPINTMAGPTTGESTSNSHIYRPPQVPLDVQQYPVAPAGLELEQVHVYMRHGERTPVGIRLAGPPASIPEHWLMCKTARQFRASVSGLTGQTGGNWTDGYLHTRRAVERSDGTVVEGQCLLGELTDIGRQSTFNYGLALRKLYIERLGFLPDSLDAPEGVYFRSTNIPRTVETLQHVIHGLYPTTKCDPSVIPLLRVRNAKDENILGNTYACKRLEILQIAFAQAAAKQYNPGLEHLDKKLSKYLNGNPIRVDGKPRASGVLDTVRAAIAHGVKVPPEFEDSAIVDVIEKAVVSEWFSDKTEEVRRLAMGRLLDDLSRKMQHKVELGNKDPLKILVHSTHDTTVAGLCSTFDVFDDRWPAFTASITFELFKKAQEQENQPSFSQSLLSFVTKPSPEYFVRMRHQNKNMILPICAEKGKHLDGSPEFCTLAAFQDRVRELTPVDWEDECAPSGRAL